MASSHFGGLVGMIFGVGSSEFCQIGWLLLFEEENADCGGNEVVGLSSLVVSMTRD